MEWLGFNIDLCKGEFSVPSNKLYSLKLQLHAVAEAQSVPARQLASVIGKIMSMSLALGPVTCLMTRNLYFVLNQKIAWCQNLSLTLEASQELRFWIKEIVKFNGHQIWPKPSAVRVVYSDASNTGYGGYIAEHGNMVANGQWSEEETKQSSTWRGLYYGSRKPTLQVEALAIFSICMNNLIRIEPEWIPRDQNKLQIT